MMLTTVPPTAPIMDGTANPSQRNRLLGVSDRIIRGDPAMMIV